MESKTFTISFELLDRFTSKYTDIQKKIQSLTSESHVVDIDVNAQALRDLSIEARNIQAPLDSVNKTLEKTTSASGNENEAIKKVNDTISKNSEQLQKNNQVADAHNSKIQQMKNHYDSLGESATNFKNLVISLGSVIASTVVAGAWVEFDKEARYLEQLIRAVEKKRPGLSTEKLTGFIEDAGKTGVVTPTERAGLAYMAAQRGIKNQDALQRTVENVEALYLQNQELLRRQYGVESASDLLDRLTKKTITRLDKQMVADIMSPKFGALEQGQRVSKLSKMRLEVDVDAELRKNPLLELSNRIANFKIAVEKELSDIFKPIASVFALLLRALDMSPAIRSIAALTVAFSILAGTAISVAYAIIQIRGAIMGLKLLSQFGGLGAMLTNPYAILIAIAAIILIVAARTGILEKAWKKFTQSEIGKDILAGLQAVVDIIMLLIDKFNEWYEASGRSTLLSFFGALVSIIETLWDDLDKVYKTIKLFNAAMGAVNTSTPTKAAPGKGETFEEGVRNAWVTLQNAFSTKNLEELLKNISYRIQAILQWGSSIVAPIITKIHDVMKRISSMIEWLYSLIQGAAAWLRDAFGVTKAQAKQKLEAASAKSGLTYLDERSGYKDLEKLREHYQWWAGAGWYKTTSESWKVKAPSTDAEVRHLEKLREQYEKAPKGFFEGIPGMSELTAAITNLITPIEYLVDAIKSLVETLFTQGANAAISKAAEGTAATLSSAGIPATAYTSETKRWLNTQTGERITDDEYFNLPLAEKLGGKWKYESMPSMAVGGKIVSDGALLAHKNEEIVPVAQAVSGPGAIANAITQLKKASGGTSHRPQYNINIVNRTELSDIKIASGVDLDDILRKIDSHIEKKSLLAVKRALENR